MRETAPIANPAQLCSVRCLDLRTGGGAMQWRVGNHHWDAAPGPHSIAANSVALLRALAERGHGVALLPEHIAASSLAARRLVRVLAREYIPSWPLFAITASRLIPRHVRLLIMHVKAELSRSPIAPRR